MVGLWSYGEQVTDDGEEAEDEGGYNVETSVLGPQDYIEELVWNRRRKKENTAKNAHWNTRNIHAGNIQEYTRILRNITHTHTEAQQHSHSGTSSSSVQQVATGSRESTVCGCSGFSTVCSFTAKHPIKNAASSHFPFTFTQLCRTTLRILCVSSVLCSRDPHVGGFCGARPAPELVIVRFWLVPLPVVQAWGERAREKGNTFCGRFSLAWDKPGKWKERESFSLQNQLLSPHRILWMRTSRVNDEHPKWRWPTKEKC